MSGNKIISRSRSGQKTSVYGLQEATTGGPCSTYIRNVWMYMMWANIWRLKSTLHSDRNLKLEGHAVIDRIHFVVSPMDTGCLENL